MVTFWVSNDRQAGYQETTIEAPVSAETLKEEISKGSARTWWELVHGEPRRHTDVLVTEWLRSNNAEYIHFTRVLVAFASLNTSNATPERLFSDLKRITSGRRATTKADLVEAYMTIQRLGPDTDKVPMEYWQKVTEPRN